MLNHHYKMRIIFIIVICFLVFQIKMAFADELKGKITSVDVNKKIVNVSGVLINTANARIEDHGDRPIQIGKLSPGDFIEVKGVFTGGGKMTASKIEKEHDEKDEIKGKIEKIDKSKKIVYIGGISLKIQEGSVIEDDDDVPITLDKLVPGTYIEAKGKWTGNKVFTVRKIEVD